MIAVDTNIVVSAHREDSPFHDIAFQCVMEFAEGLANWAISWPCPHEFLAIATHPRIYRPPTPLACAFGQVDAWLESPTLALLAESTAHWSSLRALLSAGRVAGALIHDARVAALCRPHGVREMWSADRDFSRFSGFPVVNPLVRRSSEGVAVMRYRAIEMDTAPAARKRLHALHRVCTSRQ